LAFKQMGSVKKQIKRKRNWSTLPLYLLPCIYMITTSAVFTSYLNATWQCLKDRTCPRSSFTW